MFDHTSLLKYVTEKWNLGPLGHRVAAAQSFAGYSRSCNRCGKMRQVFFPFPLRLRTLSCRGMNANQTALVGFSRFLETKIADAAGNTDDVLRDYRPASADFHAERQVTPSSGGRLENFLGRKKTTGALPVKVSG